MPVFMQTLTPSKSYDARDYRYERFSRLDLADGTLTLNVRRGRKTQTDVYDLQCERGEDGMLTTVYLAKQNDPDGHILGVLLSATLPLVAHCNCSGFGRWGTCKHECAVIDLFQRGYLEQVDEEGEGDPDFQGGWTDFEIECYEEFLEAEKIANQQLAEETIRALIG